MSMKRTFLSAVVIAFTLLATSNSAAAQQRYIVRTTGGLNSVLNLCLSAGCQVQGSLDGPVGQTYLVTSTGNLLVNLLNGVVNLLDSLLGIQSIEADRLLPIPVHPITAVASGLYDNSPVNFYGSVVTHGYATQPAAQIIRLYDAQ